MDNQYITTICQLLDQTEIWQSTIQSYRGYSAGIAALIDKFIWHKSHQKQLFLLEMAAVLPLPAI